MIKKAIIPAAGLGTRMLPLTKTQPKEMLPLGAKPCIQYIVEELVSTGIDQILIITGQKKRSIEDHFDRNNELNRLIYSSGQADMLEKLDYENMDVQYFYTSQDSPAGLGDAVRHARNFVNNEPFVIALGDSVIYSSEEDHLLKRMLRQFEKDRDAFVVGTREVAIEDVSKYGIVKLNGDVSQGVGQVIDVVEKPSPKSAPSNLAFAARYVMPCSIFDALERTSPGKAGEIQLTDAIRILLKEGAKGYCVSLTPNEKRYDIGNMASYYEAFTDFALSDERYGYQLRKYLINKLNL
jgi:UTP--glucose-1-phosphate uridylyltransferase